MAASFDRARLVELGWRQGSIVGPDLTARARDVRPAHVEQDEADCLIVISQDCDLLNPGLDKEPVAEILRAKPLPAREREAHFTHGRNPRRLQFPGDASESGGWLEALPLERWYLPRDWLLDEDPTAQLPAKSLDLVRRWLARRYTRPAFPDAFERRWRGAKGERAAAWTDLLRRHSSSIRGVYVRLDRWEELPDSETYRLTVLVVTPAPREGESAATDVRLELEGAVEAFWSRLPAGLILDECEVRSADEVTLATIEACRLFDAEWISDADGSALQPDP